MDALINKCKYDVAISFAGEHRDYAFELAKQLKKCDINVFYDKWDTVELWGTDLVTELPKRYAEESLFAVVLFSQEYPNKMYTRMEFEFMQQRQFMEQDRFILLISLDGSRPVNYPQTRSFINANDFSVDRIALLIRDIVDDKKEKLYPRADENSEDKDTQSVDRKHMTIINDDGTKKQVEIVISFRFKDSGKEFVVYTDKEYDDNGDITVYVSRIDRSNGNPKLIQVEDEDWPRVKETLWELSRDDKNNHPQMPDEPFYEKDGMEIM